MNDLDDTTRLPDGFRRDIEDNYPEYPEDEYGYTYDAWDLLSLSEVDRHDELEQAPLEVLDALDDELDDLERLAVARAFRRHGRDDDFIRLCRAILGSDERHPAVVYPEIAVFGARELAREDQPRARAWLDEFAEEIDELMEGRILQAVLEDLLTDSSDLLDTLVEEYEDEPELYYEIAEEFLRQQAGEPAREWLQHARKKAEAVGDRTTLIDIELLEAQLPAE